MKHLLFSIACLTVAVISCQSQKNKSASRNITETAKQFIQLLAAEQKEKMLIPFASEERLNWHFVPKNDRKGIALKELNDKQKQAAMDLLHAALSDSGFKKATSIIQLETILKEVEGRPVNDDHRDPGKYYFSIFGNPSPDSIWGLRLEGHHISLNFSAIKNKLISGSPGFFGSNPAVVLAGPEKGKQILKDETMLGFSLLNSLNEKQIDVAVFSKNAPADILTSNSRKAIINDPKGILYSELNKDQQGILMQLLSVYIHRYTRSFANVMMKEIETAGLNNLRFAWAGTMKPGIGNPHYYRITGPTIIIEYDNTQNNANHVHSVVRDLKLDFGGDQLLEHYNASKH